jgi:probable rRNA maturation factor
MILFEYANVEPLNLTLEHKQWLKSIIRHESLVPGNISYLFCNDQCLLQRNLFFLHHDTLTDIITFDDCIDKLVQGNIIISLERVRENALNFGVSFQQELLRVMAHGVLHLCGYKDKLSDEAKTMREKEAEAIDLYVKTIHNNNQ